MDHHVDPALEDPWRGGVLSGIGFHIHALSTLFLAVIISLTFFAATPRVVIV